MLNKIEKFRAFGDVRMGVQRWSNTTDAYLFGGELTGLEQDGAKEYSYCFYEYSRFLSVAEARQYFVDAYLAYKGFDAARQLKISLLSDEKLKAEFTKVLNEANRLSEGIQ